MDRLFDVLWPSFVAAIDKIPLQPKTSSPEKTRPDERDLLINLLETAKRIEKKVEPVLPPLTNSDLDVEYATYLINKLVEELGRVRPLIISWVSAGYPVGFVGKSLLVAYPKESKMVMESLSKRNHAEVLSLVLSRVHGEPLEFLPVALGKYINKPAAPPPNSAQEVAEPTS